MPAAEPPVPVASASGYLVPPPVTGAAVVWPEDFGTRFTVMIDTEEAFDWARPLDRTSHSTEAVVALPAAQARFAARGVPLALMVDYPVVADPAAADILRRLMEEPGTAIGAQLHAWVNPPFEEVVSGYNSFAGNLPPALEAAKIDMLTDAIATAVGTRPTAYRAGRYGIGPATFALLTERGYRLDSSMRARYDYSAEGGPDFRAIGNDVFWVGPGGALVELPLTTVFTGLLAKAGPALYRQLGTIPRARGLFARTAMLSRVALTPEGMPLVDALEAVRVAIGEGVRVLNFSFHSPSLVPGNTPYVRDAADLDAFYRWWEAMFDLLDRRGARPIGLDALIDAAG